MRTFTSFIALSCLLAGSVAAAQPVANDFDNLPLNSPVVYVVAEHGAETKGRLMAFDQDSLTLWIDGRRIVFQRHDVWRVYRRGDSLRNGMAFGALAGTIASVGVAARIPVSGCDSFATGTRVGCKALSKFLVWVIAAPAGIAFGLGAGAAIDALFTGRTLIYERSRPRSLGIVPVVTSDQTGLAMSFRW